MQEMASAKASRRTAPASSAIAPVAADRRGAEDDGDRGGERRAEHEQQGQQQQRQRDQLGAVNRGHRRAGALARQQRHSGRGGADGRRDALVDEPLGGRAAMRDLVVRAADRQQHERAVGGRTQGGAARRGRPRADHADAGALGEPRHERLALRLDVRTRAAQQNGHRRRVAEVAADKRAGLRGLRARNLQPAGRQAAVDAQADDAADRTGCFRCLRATLKAHQPGRDARRTRQAKTTRTF